jgi:hypothetical protein
VVNLISNCYLKCIKWAYRIARVTAPEVTIDGDQNSGAQLGTNRVANDSKCLPY